jgi:hypothetical protein
MRLFLCLAVAGLCCIPPGATAGGGVYKWVDAEGNTHYGERPPVGEPVEELHLPPPPPAAELERARGALEQLREQQQRESEERQQARRAEQEKQAGAERQQRWCAEQRQALETLISLPMRRIGVRGADGQARRVTEAEWQEKIRRAKENIDKFCR